MGIYNAKIWLEIEAESYDEATEKAMEAVNEAVACVTDMEVYEEE